MGFLEMVTLKVELQEEDWGRTSLPLQGPDLAPNHCHSTILFRFNSPPPLAPYLAS